MTTPESSETIRMPSSEPPLDSSDERPAVAAGRTSFGPYRIEQEISRGGMGIVYRAFHPEMDRAVALKVMRAGWQAGREEVARFEREARAMASLQHPGIVRVLDSGIVDDTPYYAMELINGQPLDELIRRCVLTRAERIRLAVEICEALQHAHERGILHRDLKPGNVLIDENTRAKLFDFGLAKLLASDGTQLTQSGWIVGTPNYMSPEQARGQPLTTASDIFSMGALFYELLTGELAFPGNDGNQVLRAIIEQHPAPPSTHDPTVDPTLDAICLKALNKLPDERYLSAKVMALDIANHSRRERMIAHRPGPIDILRAHLARRWRIWLAGLCLAALTTGFVRWRLHVVGDYRERIAALEQDVEELRRGRSAARLELRRRQARVDYFRGRWLLEQDRLQEALQLFREAWDADSEFEEARRQMAAALHRLGRKAADRGELHQALAHLREAVRQDPRQLDAYLELVDVCWRLRDIERARHYGNRFVQLRPRDVRGHLALGRIELAAGRMAPAYQRARLALSLDSRSAEAWSLLGGTLLASGKPNEAISALDRSVKLAPSWRALHRRAHAHQAAGRLDRALADTTAALELRQGDIRSLLLRGLLLQQTGQPQPAARCFEQVLAGRAQSAHETTICHAHALLRLSRDEDALVALKQWWRHDPRDAEPLRLMGRLFERQQRWQDARQAWAEVLRRRPSDAKAIEALARLRHR